MKDRWTIVLGLFALGNLASAIWMLASPSHWYTNIPAAVPDFGPLNEHFVRDVGGTYLMMGAGLAWAAFDSRVRFPIVALVTIFYWAHAFVHVYDTASSRVGPEHWGIDFAPIYLPALVLLWMLRPLSSQAANRQTG